jgi:hypothetical protein
LIKILSSWSQLAVQALQESAEVYITKFFEFSNRLAIHAKRSTVMVRDMQTVVALRQDVDPILWSKETIKDGVNYGWGRGSGLNQPKTRMLLSPVQSEQPVQPPVKPPVKPQVKPQSEQKDEEVAEDEEVEDGEEVAEDEEVEDGEEVAEDEEVEDGEDKEVNSVDQTEEEEEEAKDEAE